MEFIQQNIYLILLALGSGGALAFLSLQGSAARGGLTPTQATLLINRENARIIDVRAADEYADGHLPEARNVPVEQIGALAEELEKLRDTQLILVCRNGTRSAGVRKQLEKMGFARVGSLAGGIVGWRAAGLPVRKGAKK
ncbi:MAG: rhodanese-like domain-containing protein [Candidatus Accumulibacter sp.]|nr:rhodanese-like domain-containing protein [Accumulibacter sp.]